MHLLHCQGWDVRVLLSPSEQGYRGVRATTGVRCGVVYTTTRVGIWGYHTTQHAAYLLAIFHCFSFRELRPSRLVPSPLDCPVQELLHLPLREDVGVPQQLVFVLIDCSERVARVRCGHVVHTHSLKSACSLPQAPTRLATTAPPKNSYHLEEAATGLAEEKVTSEHGL